MQHIGVFVQAQLVGHFAGGIQLIVFGNFVAIFIEDFQTETFLRLTVVVFAML